MVPASFNGCGQGKHCPEPSPIRGANAAEDSVKMRVRVLHLLSDLSDEPCLACHRPPHFDSEAPSEGCCSYRGLEKAETDPTDNCERYSEPRIAVQWPWGGCSRQRARRRAVPG